MAANAMAANAADRLTVAQIAVVLFGPPGRGGFNQAGLDGAVRARAYAPEIEVHWCEAPQPAARADFLRKLAARNGSPLSLIIAHGGQGDAPVAEVAPQFPALRFAITQGSTLAPNVACYEVLQEQSAFLAGVLAAVVTQSGVVAHLSGERVRPGLKGRAAFAAGVLAQDAKVRLLTLFCGDQHAPALAYRAVCTQADAGADVLFAMIDGGRDGAIRACRERGVAQIGNVFDWTVREPDVFIASAIADSGHCIELAVQDALAGRFAGGGKREIGLESGDPVRLAFAPRVDAAARVRVAHFQQMIEGGALDIPVEYFGPEMVFAGQA